MTSDRADPDVRDEAGTSSDVSDEARTTPDARDEPTTTPVDELVTHREAIVDGIRLHYVEAGPADAPLVVFLHGFPESWYTWRRQLPALVEAGFRVVAPELRGYGRSEKPRGVDAYRLEALVDDAVGLIRACGEDRATVVGHDWGGVVAWATAVAHPDALDRLVVLNAPHPIEYVREPSLEQLARSWYGIAVQPPWLPEALLWAGNGRVLEWIYREGPARPDAFPDADVERFTEALGRPGALTAALSYYRAFLRWTVPEHLPGSIPVVGPRLVDPVEPIETPTLVLWGERDPALAIERTEGLDRYATDVRVERFPDTSHWVHVDRPAAVTDAVLAFLGEAGRTG